MQALIITAYKNYEMLYENLIVLSRYFDCYVHIDKKSEISTMDNLKKLNELKNVYVISKYKIYWGGYKSLKSYFRFARRSYEKLKYSEISYYKW